MWLFGGCGEGLFQSEVRGWIITQPGCVIAQPFEASKYKIFFSSKILDTNQNSDLNLKIYDMILKFWFYQSKIRTLSY